MLRRASVKRRGALALRRAGFKRRGASGTVSILRAFWLRFDRFVWDFVWDISRGHFWELE